MSDPTIHYIGFIRRRAGMSHADFSHHWGTVHRDLVMDYADPGPILQYVQDVGLETLPTGLAGSFDGSPELWIRGEAGLAELFAAEGFRYAYEVDSPLFITMPAISFFVTDRVVQDGPTDGFKLMRLIAAPAPEARANLARQWNEATHPVGMTGSGGAGAKPLRLVRAQIVSAEAAGTNADAYWGIESSWWPDADSAARAWQARDAALTGSEQILLARERVVMPLAAAD